MLRIGFTAPREEFAECLVVGRVRQLLPELAGERDDPVPPLRLAHDSANRRRVVLEQEDGDRPVGRNHEVLDQVARPVAPRDREIDHLAIHHHRRRLDALEIECSRQAPRSAQPLRRVVLHAHLFAERRPAGDCLRRGAVALEPGADRVVGKLCAVVDECSVDERVAECAVARDIELDDDGKAILAFVERGEVGRQSLGQHRKDGDASVDGCRVGRRVLVRRGAERDERLDVGNADADANTAVSQRLAHLDLVEVARAAVVDRRPWQCTHVACARRQRIVGRVIERPYFQHHRGGKVGIEPVRPHRCLRGGEERGASRSVVHGGAQRKLQSRSAVNGIPARKRCTRNCCLTSRCVRAEMVIARA